MHFSTLLLSVPFLASIALADEVVYLVNCNYTFNRKGGQADYYKEISQSQNGQQPDDGSVAHLTSDGSLYNFEGQNDFFFSDTGVTFHSSINAGANGIAVGAFAGTGNNGKPFNCFRDSRRALTPQCTAEYYCRPA